MFDEDLKKQLKEVFSKLDGSVAFSYQRSSNSSQPELLSFLSEIVATSSKLSLVEDSDAPISAVPRFSLVHNGTKTRLHFTGIPGGHEFSSLVLAILNADGKGKVPEQIFQDRIKKLKGPISLKTFISLSCENCPDVVQALNQIALIHPGFTHEMIDGAFAEDEIKALSIQGVPSIVNGATLINSGKISFFELLTKLEETFGTSLGSQASTESRDLGHYDVLIVGGGPAGASAAIYSARKGLRTAMIAERFGGQVQDTKGIENLISVPYTEGPKLSAELMKHVQSYPITLLEHRKVKNLIPAKEIRDPNIIDGHVLELESGENISGEAVIVTTGAKWRELGVPGEKEYLGRGVAFCPHCDGPFYKGKKVAVIGGGNSGVEAAIDLAGIVKEVVLFEFMDQLKADQVLLDKLNSLPNVSFVTSAKTEAIIGDGTKVVGLEFTDRNSHLKKTVLLDGVFIQIGLLPNSGFLKKTNVALTKFGEIIIDEKNRTSVPNIYAAGDVTTTPYKQIIISMGEGAKAALAAFEDRMKAPIK
jgi:alkyl hydroperoxide reductase subunit F